MLVRLAACRACEAGGKIDSLGVERHLATRIFFTPGNFVSQNPLALGLGLSTVIINSSLLSGTTTFGGEKN